MHLPRRPHQLKPTAHSLERLVDILLILYHYDHSGAGCDTVTRCTAPVAAAEPPRARDMCSARPDVTQGGYNT